MTIGGNKTLKGLSSGNHSIVVFGNNTFGDMTKSETMNFTIKEPETSFELTVISNGQYTGSFAPLIVTQSTRQSRRYQPTPLSDAVL